LLLKKTAWRQLIRRARNPQDYFAHPVDFLMKTYEHNQFQPTEDAMAICVFYELEMISTLPPDAWQGRNCTLIIEAVNGRYVFAYLQQEQKRSQPRIQQELSRC
jgi:hypothetical protein